MGLFSKKSLNEIQRNKYDVGRIFYHMIDRSMYALLFFLSHNTCDAFLVLQDIIRTSSISETKELFRQVYTIGHSLLSLKSDCHLKSIKQSSF